MTTDHVMDIASKWNLNIFRSNIITRQNEIVIQWERGSDIFQVLVTESQACELILALTKAVEEFKND
jgi:hypothetical protein